MTYDQWRTTVSDNLSAVLARLRTNSTLEAHLVAEDRVLLDRTMTAEQSARLTTASVCLSDVQVSQAHSGMTFTATLTYRYPDSDFAPQTQFQIETAALFDLLGDELVIDLTAADFCEEQ